MHALQTPLTALETTFQREPESAAFKIPELPLEIGKPCAEWKTVSYRTFRDDIRVQALHWSKILKGEGVALGSVITLWLRGWEYADVTLIYGVVRAGYVPQLVSFGVPSAEAIYEVAQSAQSRLLVADHSLSERLSACPLPVKLYTPAEHPAGLRTPSEEESATLPTLEGLVKDPQDTAFILLTSGSTSGKPKWVPYTWDWLEAKMPGLDLLMPPKADHGGQQVYAWMGTACHGGQFHSLIGSMKHGSCMVQPSTIPFSSDELRNMVSKCGVTTLLQFPPHYSIHIKRARQDPELLSILQKLDCTVLIGMILERDEMDWCLEQGIKLRSGFGSTECGTILTTIPDRPWLYKPADSSAIIFRPVEDEFPTTGTTVATGTSTSPSQNLHSLIVHSSARDCPAPHLRSPSDGHYHMGDLFAEIEPGVYEPRGRADDWIKLANLALGRCDTKAIESAVLGACRDLVSACVVTGSLRPELILFVEVDGATLGTDSERELKKEILRRLEPLQEKMWTYEKIVREGQVRVVGSGVLPRTGVKGNIQRRKVEEMFKEELDEMYRSVVA